MKKITINGIPMVTSLGAESSNCYNVNYVFNVGNYSYMLMITDGTSEETVYFINNIASGLRSGSFTNPTPTPTPTEIPSLMFPNQTNVIRKEAFEGDTMIEIVIPESCTKIENRAFANCKNLQKVTILAKDIEIEDDAFAGCDQVIFYAVKGSDALAYAFKNGLYYSTI